MTKEYAESVHQMNKLKREAIKLNTPAARMEYRQNRNAAKKMRNKLKLQSISTAIQDNGNQSKIAWKVFNDETGKTKTNGIIYYIIIKYWWSLTSRCIFRLYKTATLLL